MQSEPTIQSENQSGKVLKTIAIVFLVVVLLASLGGNVWQYLQLTQYQQQVSELQSDLNDSIRNGQDIQTKLDASLAQATEMKASLEDLQKKYGDLNDRNVKANADLTAAKERLNFVECQGASITSNQLNGIVTNQNLTDLITQAVESDYGISSVETSYSVIWNNSKTAIFTIQMSDRTTAKVAVSWSWKVSGRILAIYSLGGACYYYSYI